MHMHTYVQIIQGFVFLFKKKGKNIEQQ